LRNQVARLTTIRPGRLVPFLFVAILLGAYQSKARLGDFILLLALGTFGWLMLRAGWSRAPFLIGFVLGPIAERYLWISISRFGAEFLLRPGVIIIGLLTLTVTAIGVIRPRGLERLRNPEKDANRPRFKRLLSKIRSN